MSNALAKEAFDNMLDLLTETVAIADHAVALASKPQPPQVTLTKVASETYHQVAGAIAKTGVFPGKTAAELATMLKQAGERGHLEFLEKLASRAMFTIEVDHDLRGDLVEKTAKNQANYSHLPKTTAVWQQARDEAESELNH